MKPPTILAALLMLASAVFCSAEERRALEPAPLFQSGMVLQQQTNAPVWGWAEPGITISVKGSWQAESVATTTDANGKWMTRIPTPEAGGPHTLTIAGEKTITLTDVLIGEVWVCGGQSNMSMIFYLSRPRPVGIMELKIVSHEAELKDLVYPEIREFRTRRSQPVDDTTPQTKLRHPSWKSSTEMGNALRAVPYFFGRQLHQKLKVPIGLIVNAEPGTNIETWTNQAGFDSVPSLTNTATPSGGQRSSHYNIVVHPVIPYAIRGAIWYQGESNIGDHMIYAEKMRALINGWRTEWAQGDFPFYYVQLTPWRSGVPMGLPKIWEAQAAALAIPNTGMIPTSDTSDMDLHPANKQDIGKRLGNMALAKTYGHKDTVCEGPRFVSMKREGKSVFITFDAGGGKLASRDGKPLTHFTIAGADRVFVSAMAVISSDNTVTVTSDTVADPASVRFGWENDAQPNLMNTAGLPAYPFRTDDWAF